MRGAGRGLFPIIAVAWALSCATKRPDPEPTPRYSCGSDSDCLAGETCVADWGRYCLVACDPQVADGHDPRCPRGFTCWRASDHVAGNVCREGEERGRHLEISLERYLSSIDGGLEGLGARSIFLIVDGGEVVGHRPLFPDDLVRDR